MLVVTSFGAGYAPVASGTFGTYPAVVIYLAIALAAPPALHAWLIAGALLIACAASIALAPWAERRWNSKDPGQFVIDEVAGFLLTVLLFRTGNILLTTIWAFLATRAFDILKPPPCRRLERLPGGWGILLDDLMASVYAAGFLHLAARFFPAWFGLPSG